MKDLACRQSIAELLLNHYSVWGIIRHATFNTFKISFWQTNLFRDLQNIIRWQWTKEQLHYLENQIDLVKQSLKFNGNTLVMTQFIGSIIFCFTSVHSSHHLSTHDLNLIETEILWSCVWPLMDFIFHIRHRHHIIIIYITLFKLVFLWNHTTTLRSDNKFITMQRNS